MANWNIDSTHTNAYFSVKHMMITTVRGHFGKIEGTLEFDPANPAAGVVDVTIDAASISTGTADRDTHLKSADFLDVENFPTITFKSTSVEVTGESSGRITGDLTIRGVTRPVVLETEFEGLQTNPWGVQAGGFTAKTKINREDFGLTWNVALETGGVLVGKEIKIEIEAEVVAATEAAAE